MKHYFFFAEMKGSLVVGFVTVAFRILLANDYAPLSTRENGERARAAVERALELGKIVVLDFAGARPAPGFADELLGHLLVKLGVDRFRAQVKLENVDDDVRPLFQTILHRRGRANDGSSRRTV